jgi:hypothetical protein
LRKFRRGLVFVSVGSVLIAACSLFTDLSDLDAQDPAALVEGGDGPPASANDGPGNPPPLDAPIDVPIVVQGDGGCPEAGFCDDFEEGTIGSKWDSMIVTAGTGTIEEDLELFVSGRRAFRSRTIAAVTPPNKSAYLRRSIAGPVPKGAVCSFAARSRIAQDAAALRWADFFQLRGTAAGVTNWDVNLGMNQGYMGVRNDINFADGSCDCPHDEIQIARTFPTNQWVNVIVETDFKSLKVFFDGVAAISAPFDFFLVPTTLGISLGVDDSQRAPHDMSFDDLACRFTY